MGHRKAGQYSEFGAVTATPRYTDDEILEWFRLYYEEGKTIQEISSATGASVGHISVKLRNERLSNKYSQRLSERQKRMELRRQVATIKAMECAPEMISQMQRIASQNVNDTPIQFQYVIQNAASNLLDRADVKMGADEGAEVCVMIDTSGIQLGEPGKDE